MEILLIDDHQVVREGVKRILEMQDDIGHIAEASNGPEALAKMESQVFDVVMLDLSMPGMDGWEVLRRIIVKWPDAHVMIFTMHPAELHGVRAMTEKALSYISKNAPLGELLNAIRAVAKGKRYLTPELANLMVDGVSKKETLQRHLTLSERELEIMLKLASGKTYGQIADELNISIKTIGAHRTNIVEKMGVKKNTELTRYCIEHQLI